jgi:hypothetical protein
VQHAVQSDISLGQAVDDNVVHQSGLLLFNAFVFKIKFPAKQADEERHGRRKQLDGCIGLIGTQDILCMGVSLLTQCRNFCGFTFMNLSETVSRLMFRGSKDTSGDGKMRFA